MFNKVQKLSNDNVRKGTHDDNVSTFITCTIDNE